MRLSTSLRLNAQKGLVTPYDPALTLDLQFAARQAYVANIGPLPTFTNASTTRTFVGSDGLIKTAATNVPRIDFDPVTRLCRGLLIEEQRTNLTIRSEDLGNATWQKVDSTASTNQGTDPSGVLAADILAETATNARHYVINNSSVVATSGTAYTQSTFLKKGTGSTAPDWIMISMLPGAFGATNVAFNVSTGQVGVVVGSPTVSVTQFPNGWWRVSLSKVATSSATVVSHYIEFTNNTNTTSPASYLGQTTSDIFIWGAQFEAGFFATSYIPTTTGSLVRSADTCSITGAAFTGFYNQTEGSIVFKGSKQSANPSISTTYVACDNATGNERILLYFVGTEVSLVTVGGVAQATVTSGINVPALTPFGMAFRYKLNDFALSLSGGSVVTDTSGTVPTNTQMTIGSRLSSSFMGGWIQSIQYYNTIKTNAQLQALSTP
jgi:hypothetical protein